MPAKFHCLFITRHMIVKTNHKDYVFNGLHSRALFGAPHGQCRGLCDGAAHVQKYNPVGENRLLRLLDADDLSRLQPNLKKFSMVRGVVLHAPGASIEHIYFPLSGMVSLLAVMRTGEQIETGI